MAEQADNAVHRMPYEGYETSVEAAASGIAGLLDSEDEEHTEEAGEEQESDEETTAEAEDTDADDEEGEFEEEEDEAEAPEQPALALDDSTEVEIDGQTVTLKELKRGFLRESDYTKKTQALAEERKSEVEQYRKAREDWSQRIDAIDAFLATSEPPKPDASLRKSDPAEYAAQAADRQQWEADRTAAQTEKQRLQMEQAAEWEAEVQARVAEESEKLAQALPEFADPVKGSEVKKALATYATGMGFTEQDLANVYDHRLVVLLDKARRYDALQQTGEKVQAKVKVAPVLKPGTRTAAPSQGRKKEQRARMERARQTGRVEDVAAVLEHMLDD